MKHFFKEENPFSYEDRIRKNLTQWLLDNLPEKNYEGEELLRLRDEIISNKDIEGTCCSEYLKGKEVEQIKKFMSNNQDLKEFFRVDGEDIEVKKFQEKVELTRAIRQVNFKDSIQVSAQPITDFVENYIQNGFQIKEEPEEYVCNLKHLPEKYQKKE